MILINYSVVKRLFDIVFALLMLIPLIPVCIIISLLILAESKGGIFYRQERIGQYLRPFTLYKFRTMFQNSDDNKLTISMRDPRITKTGYFLRKYKLDELPQIINILSGEMSIVGPRPEVREHVDLFIDDYEKILTVKPGLTDYASLLFANENQILESFPNPHEAYISYIMPKKIKLNKRYVRDISLYTDLKLIAKTFLKLFFIKGYYVKMEYFPS